MEHKVADAAQVLRTAQGMTLSVLFVPEHHSYRSMLNHSTVATDHFIIATHQLIDIYFILHFPGLDVGI